MRDSYTNRNHCPSQEMWSYERDGRWWGWSFVRGSTVLNQNEFRIATVAMFTCDLYAGSPPQYDLERLRTTMQRRVVDFVRLGYFIPLNGPLNGHPPSLVYKMGNNQVKNWTWICSNFSQGYFCSKLDTNRCSMMDLPFYWEAHCIFSVNNIGLYMAVKYCNTFAITRLA